MLVCKTEVSISVYLFVPDTLAMAETKLPIQFDAEAKKAFLSFGIVL